MAKYVEMSADCKIDLSELLGGAARNDTIKDIGKKAEAANVQALNKARNESYLKAAADLSSALRNKKK